MSPGDRPVREIMETDVVTVPPDRTVGEMLERFRRAGISGAPVVEETDGRVLGVVSLADVVRAGLDRAEVELAEAEKSTGIRTEGRWGRAAPALRRDLVTGSGFFHLPRERGPGRMWTDRAGTVSPELREVRVRDLMTPVLTHVEPETPLREVARVLAAEGVHRILVFRGTELAGLTTTFDVLEALTRIDGRPEGTADGARG